MKLTLELNLPAAPTGPTPAAFIAPLSQVMPSLTRHRCCGDNRIHETFFTRERRRACAMRETDETVDVAHLLEHLVIDFQHDIADMRICSGVTCGYERPRHRYDLFIESPGPAVSRLCVDLARALMNDLLRGAAPDPIYPGIAKLARQFHRSPGRTVSAAAAARIVALERRSRQALRALQQAGFIEEVETSINFSR